MHPALARVSLSALVAVLFSASLLADIVHLRDGKTIEGRVERDPRTGAYTIYTPNGKVTKPASAVLRVEPKELPEDEFEARYRKVRKTDLDALAELVVFAREKRLTKQKRRACRDLLAIDPNHELARYELGFRVYKNAWITDKELRAKRKELGLVKYRGEWMEVAERERRIHEDDRTELARWMESVRSENPVVKDYAVRKILAYRGQRADDLFVPWLDSKHAHVRLVSVSALARFPHDKRSDAAGKKRAHETARALFELSLHEPDPAVRQALELCLRRFHPDDSFARAVAVLQSEAPEESLQRASVLVDRLLLKKRVPKLCRALVSRQAGQGRQHEPVRAVLRKLFEVDHGFEVQDWLDWWSENSQRYRDQP